MCALELISTCAISMSFKGHIYFCSIYGYSIENKRCSFHGVFLCVFLLLICAVMWDLHVDYIIWSHDSKKSCCTSFYHIDPRNAVVPLIMLLASCNADASTNTDTLPKNLWHIISIVIDLRNTVVPLITPLA